MEGDELIARMIAATPLKRLGHAPLFGSPEDIAGLVAFWCSERASFITSCDIRVDGARWATGGISAHRVNLSLRGSPVALSPSRSATQVCRP
jgi:hypothetical protein